MRVLAGFLLVTALLIGAPGNASSGPPKTEVVQWSPLDSSGKLKSTLRVKTVDGRCTDIGYTFVGGIGYRCGYRNFLLDACFRDGPKPTEYVICINSPWEKRVIRLHSPRLLLYPGVTFTAAARYPWGIVLDDGNRCGVVQGAHDALTAHGRRYIVDYDCEQNDVVLLREGIERGRVWRINAARLKGPTLGYTFLGHVPARRVYFGTLPPAMARQNTLANKAYNAVVRIFRRRTAKGHLGVTWVRLALPQADWAYVISTLADENDRGYFRVLHRADGRWTDASAYRPYCTNLPKRVRRQLFLPKKAPTSDLLAPRGETRC